MKEKKRVLGSVHSWRFFRDFKESCVFVPFVRNVKCHRGLIWFSLVLSCAKLLRILALYCLGGFFFAKLLRISSVTIPI